MVMGALLRLLVVIYFSAASAVHASATASVGEEDPRKVFATRLQQVENARKNAKANLSNRIFTESLSKEFRDKYHAEFGQTMAEQTVVSPGRFTYFTGNAPSLEDPFYSARFHGDEVERAQANHRFGNFMIRRMTEYHFEQYARSKPAIQKIQRAKEQISTLNLQLTEKTKLKGRYGFSGNYVKLKLINPWLENDVLIQMNPESLGPSDIREVMLSTGIPLSKKSILEFYVRAVEKSLTVIARRTIRENLSATLSSRSGRLLIDPQLPRPYEQLLMVGLAWNY